MSMTQANGTPLQILMIEDSLAFARLTIVQLKSTFPLPHVVHHFDNVARGLTSISVQQPDLIILDLHLPDSHGLDTYDTVRSAAPETPIVILSSEDSEDIALAAIQRGADDYMVKGNGDRMALIRTLRFAVERKRRLSVERELDAARLIQQSLLPSADPQVEGYDIAGVMIPAADAAGDYFDFILPVSTTDEQVTEIVVGDVSGHGHGPAMVMAETRGCLHAFTRMGVEPARKLQLTSEVLTTSDHQHFVTMFLGQLDPDSHSFVYASAGHEAWYFPRDGATRSLDSTGFPLGIVEDVTWDTDQLQFAPGDLLVIVTDGIVETGNPAGDMYGNGRLTALIEQYRHESAAMIIAQLKDDVHEFSEGATQNDDITIVIVKVNEATDSC